MLNVLEVAIGLVFVYLILSLVLSAINEGIVSLTGRRAAYLEKGIENLLGKTLKDGVYGHGLVEGLRQQGAKLNTLPSYIKPSTFSTVLRDVLGKVEMPVAGAAPAQGSAPSFTHKDQDVVALAMSVQTLKTPGATLRDKAIPESETGRVDHLAEALTALCKEAGDFKDVKKGIENWFDESMERVSGWYKRRTRAILFGVGLALVVAVNADTLNIVNTLWLSPSIRESVVAAATQTVEAGAPEDATDSVAGAIDQLKQLQLPLGWVDADAEDDPRRLPTGTDWIAKAFGLLLTAIALTFGAPFWFDLLKKFVGIQSSGQSPTAASTGTATGSTSASTPAGTS